jgi:hypothetical protein
VTYLLYGATLGFTWFLVLNLTLSLASAAVAPWTGRWLSNAGASARARALLALRLAPAAVSVAFVAGVFLPSFLRLEPRNFDEAFGVTTTTFAAASLALVVAALWRGAAALAEAARHTRRWLRSAVAIGLPQSPVPAFCVDLDAPAMTLVGVFRPKLLVTRSVLELLSPEELSAAIEHEAGHRRAWDNLKRLIMRATPDALSVLPACRRLEHEWALAAEQAADAHAAHDASCGVALASALVKVARLTPASNQALVSPLVGGEAIALRVSQLLNPPARRARSIAGDAAMIGLAMAGIALVVVRYGPLLETVHDISEVVVRVLP